jgi:peptidoglycan/LPS O-acetylase OafA/YrhL
MRRIAELDAVRGLAALAVVVFHLRFAGLFPLLGTAVDLFFVLSGYLITRIILEQSRAPHFLRNFYARRALRIWPIYYLTFLALFVLNPLLPHPQSLAGLPYFLTYTQFIQGYWFGTFPPFSHLYRHTWTLAIEEQFYVFWPLLVLVTGRRYLWVAIVPLLVAPTLLRTWDFFPHLLATRCDGLALGALLAFLLGDRDRLERRRPAYGLAFALVTLAALGYPAWRAPIIAPIQRAWPGQAWPLISSSLNTLRICVLYFGVVGLLLCYSGHALLRPLRDRRLCYLGQISYGLYLYHPFVFTACTLIHFALGLDGSWWIDALKVAVCIGVAALSWAFVERPLLALKDRLTYGRGRHDAGQSGEGPHGPRLTSPASRAAGRRRARDIAPC